MSIHDDKENPCDSDKVADAYLTALFRAKVEDLAAQRDTCIQLDEGAISRLVLRQMHGEELMRAQEHIKDCYTCIGRRAKRYQEIKNDINVRQYSEQFGCDVIEAYNRLHAMPGPGKKRSLQTLKSHAVVYVAGLVTAAGFIGLLTLAKPQTIDVFTTPKNGALPGTLFANDPQAALRYYDQLDDETQRKQIIHDLTVVLQDKPSDAWILLQLVKATNRQIGALDRRLAVKASAEDSSERAKLLRIQSQAWTALKQQGIQITPSFLGKEEKK